MAKSPSYEDLQQRIEALEKEVTEHHAIKKALKESQSQLKKTNKALRKKVAERKQAEERYRFLYEFAPISLSEVDCSYLKEHLDLLKKEGVEDFRSYFATNPQALAECAQKTRMVSVNAATVQAFKAGDKKELLDNTSKKSIGGSPGSFRDGIIAYAEGKESFECEIPAQTVGGETRFFFHKWTYAPGKEKQRKRIIGALVDITKTKQVEQALKEKQRDLEAQNIRLQEMNAALKVLIENREKDKTELEEKVLDNVKGLASPILASLKRSNLDLRQRTCVEMLEIALEEIVAPFLHTLSQKHTDLTRTEVVVANLVREGKSTRKIAEILNVSKRSIDTYRTNLRKKLGIGNKKVNLRSYLLSLQ